jgi:hypothetical protein
MALSGNQRPDHSTIAAFVSSMQDQILSLYCNILLVCEQENLLGGTFFALDFRTTPVFETSSEKYGWINRIVAVGVGKLSKNKVIYKIYMIL